MNTIALKIRMFPKYRAQWAVGGRCVENAGGLDYAAQYRIVRRKVACECVSVARSERAAS